MGTVFSISADGRNFSVINSAPAGVGGRHPVGQLSSFNGEPLYGVAVKGGAHGKGVIYRVNANGRDYAVVHSFSGGMDGANPQSGLVFAGDSLFGTTTPLETGTDSATIFRINVFTGSYGVIHRFNPTTDGSSPNGTLEVVGRTLIGVTANGGISNGGTLYKFELSPEAIPQSVVTSPGTPVAVTLSGMPTDGFPQTFATRFGPFNGVLTGTPPNVTYRSNPGFSGEDGFRFTVNNGVGTSESVQVTIKVRAGAPTIAALPATHVASAGETVTFKAIASSVTPVNYQWSHGGNPLAGATTDTLTLTGVRTSQAGDYSVTVKSAAGAVTSTAVAVTINPASVIGAYFVKVGTASQSSLCSIFVRADRSAVLRMNLENGQTLTATTTIDADGFFTATTRELAGVSTTTARTISGRIARQTLNATMSGLSSPLAAEAVAATSAVAGTYFATTVGLSPADIYFTVSDTQVHAIVVRGTTIEAGLGSIKADGVITLTLDSGATLSGRVNAITGQLSATVIAPNTDTTSFTGIAERALAERRLSNISTRALTGTADNALITGFVLQGNSAKPLLIRAAGPALSTFGVAGALAQPQIQLFQGNVVVAANAGWSDASNSALIAETAVRLGAFAFSPTNRDAALLRTLPPGAYTAVVSGVANTTGITLVEVYDTSGELSRLVNLSTRGMVGQGDQVLIVGVVVTGNLPKRLLIRAVGPTLAGFGAANVIADPRLEIRQGATIVAVNDNWSNDSRVASAATAVGAFALSANSNDSALLISLAPGTYSAVVSGVNGATGVALVEAYEVP